MLSDPQPGEAAPGPLGHPQPVGRAEAYGSVLYRSYIGNLTLVLYWQSYIDLISILYRLFFFWFHIDCYAFAQHPRQFVQQLGLVSYGHAGVDVNSLTVVELPHAARFE